MRNYIIADNQDITKAGIQFLLNKLKEAGDISEACNKAELLKTLRECRRAVVILDYTCMDFAGTDELIVIQESFKDADWLLFSDDLSVEFLRRTILSCNAFGVVMKDSPKEEIIAALQCATRKEKYICNRVSNLLLSAGKNQYTGEDHRLTPTEKLILKEIASGKTTKEIAVERNLSFHTVNSHRKNIFRKLEVNNVHEATKYAMRAGIVDLAEYYI